MSITIKFFISDDNVLFAEGIRLIISEHFSKLGIPILFLEKPSFITFADFVFITHEKLFELRRSEITFINENSSKLALISPFSRLLPSPFDIKWILHRHHTVNDLLALVDAVFHIREVKVDKNIIQSRMPSPIIGVTPRQWQVITLFSHGMSPERISRIMKINVKTVSCHKRNLMKKFNLKHSADLYFWLNSHFFISSSPSAAGAKTLLQSDCLQPS